MHCTGVRATLRGEVSASRSLPPPPKTFMTVIAIWWVAQ